MHLSNLTFILLEYFDLDMLGHIAQYYIECLIHAIERQSFSVASLFG